jgi:predicted nucleic acid-binding protein
MSSAIVLNTSPTLALIAALGSVDLLAQIYERVLFSDTVAQELRQAGQQGFGVLALTRLCKKARRSSSMPWRNRWLLG